MTNHCKFCFLQDKDVEPDLDNWNNQLFSACALIHVNILLENKQTFSFVIKSTLYSQKALYNSNNKCCLRSQFIRRKKFSSSYPLILHQVFCGCSKTLDPPPPVHIKIQSSKLGSGAMGQRQPWWWWRYNLTSTTSFYRVTSPYATGLLYSRAIGNSPAGFPESADIVVSQQLTEGSSQLRSFRVSVRCSAI